MKNANQALLGVAMVGLLGGSMMATTGSGSTAIERSAAYTDATDVPVGTDPVPSTTVPGASTTVPGASTTVPGASTTVPAASTTVPGASTTVPAATTTVPGATTTVPGATTTVPGASTTVPGASTTVPGASTTVPGATTTIPGPTTTTPAPRVLSLGDLVWFDNNGDGRFDSRERGLPGVDVVARYLGADGVIGGGDDEMFRATTNGDGAYLINNLPAGIYEISIGSGLPGGVVATFDPDSGIASPDGATRLVLDASNFDQDFGYRFTSSIGDTVFRDLNRNGVQDPGEPGLPGVIVLLTRNDGVSYDRVGTNSQGQYLFPGLAPGTYAVVIDQGRFPDSSLVLTAEEDGTLDGDTVVVLGANENHLTADFGYAEPAPTGTASIGDLVYLDLDGNGTRDAGEPGVADQLVKLTSPGPDGLIGTQDDTTRTVTTDGSGAYLFDGLLDGQYIVMIVGGITDTTDNTADPDGGTPNVSNVTIVNQLDDLDQDFGYHTRAVRGGNTIGDTVWFDTNGNGVDDAGEPRLAGVNVTVTWLGPDAARGGGDDVLIGVFTTDSNGRYLATQLPDGRFSVDVTGGVPAGLVITFDPQGSTNPDGKSTVTVSGGKSNIDQDFGYTGTAPPPPPPLLGSIGDTVYFDTDGNGTQGDPATEPGIGGVVVLLSGPGPDGFFSTPDDVLLQTTTDADGHYLFDQLPAGFYEVEIIGGLPADVVKTGGPDGRLTLAAGEKNLDQDFGYGPKTPVVVITTGVGDTVWVDTNGNGVRDSLEPGVGGLPISVQSAGPDGVFGTADDVLKTTVTDPSGTYFVDGLPAGPAIVSYDPGALPAGFVPTSDADGGSGPQAAVTTIVLVAGTPDRSVDFAVGGTASIHGVVFNDRNRNGVPDPGETGAPGVVVTVTCQTSNGPIVMRAVTAHDGGWTLVNLPAGVCQVTVPGAPPRTITLKAGHPTDVRIGVLGAGGGAGTPPQQPPGNPPPLPATGTDPLVILLLALGLVLGGSAIMWSPQISSLMSRARNGASRARD